MRRIIVLTFCCLLLIAGCKSKNNSGWVVDSTKINSEGIEAVTLGDGTKVIAIADVENAMSADLFKGSFNDSLLAVLAPDGEFASAINAFLIVRDDDIVLVDAGLGNDKGGQLLAKLAFLGVRPENVTAILLTHLHADHIGGLLRDGQPAFPNAQLFLSVDEFNAWADGGVMAARNESWKEVLSFYADKVNLFVDGDTLLGGWVEAHLAPGHTPGHSVYQVGNCLFVGDLVHAQALQLDHPQFCASYDGDYAQSVATRQRVLSLVKEKGLALCGAHCYEPFVRL